jgi:hypothetical protein
VTPWKAQNTEKTPVGVLLGLWRIHLTTLIIRRVKSDYSGGIILSCNVTSLAQTQTLGWTKQAVPTGSTYVPGLHSSRFAIMLMVFHMVTERFLAACFGGGCFNIVLR